MRKRNIAVLLLTVLLLAGLTGCARRGDTSGVEIVVGASEQFSDEDIRGAMDAAMRAFHRGHSGCAMVRLAYNEAYRTCWLAGAGAQDDGNTIVLLASVYARDPGRRSGLTAGETYTDWPIVLERRGSGWHVAPACPPAVRRSDPCSHGESPCRWPVPWPPPRHGPYGGGQWR